MKSVETIVTEQAIDCDFRRAGKLKLAAKPQHFAGLEKTFNALRRDVDPDIELIDLSHIRDEIASDGFTAALQRNGAQMHMASSASASRRPCAPARTHAAVTQLDRLDGERHRITSARGTIVADRVLVATGASQHGPFAWFRRRIAPVGSFIVVTEPLPDAQLNRLFPHRRAYVTSRQIGNYFRVTPDNRLLFGGRARFAMSAALRREERRRPACGHGRLFPGTGERAARLLLGRPRRHHPTGCRAASTTASITRWATAATACRCRCTWAA